MSSSKLYKILIFGNELFNNHHHHIIREYDMDKNE